MHEVSRSCSVSATPADEEQAFVVVHGRGAHIDLLAAFQSALPLGPPCGWRVSVEKHCSYGEGGQSFLGRMTMSGTTGVMFIIADIDDSHVDENVYWSNSGAME